MKSFAFAAALIAATNAVELEWGQGYGYGYAAPVVKTQPKQTYQGASKAYGSDAARVSGSDWDSWGRDQDLSIKESYGKTNAKSYAAESYDEWDNTDNDRWGAQAWGKDRDGYGASSYGKAASDVDVNRAYGAKGGYGAQAGSKWAGASAQYGAAQGGYDNDVWAKQAYGQDTDSRWGKSYDSVEAKSYDNEHYARKVAADDDQWAEDYDRYDARDQDAYGRAASAASKNGGYGGWGKQGGSYSGASQDYGAAAGGRSASDWDAWGRDQDYLEEVSYDKTNAKAYAAESYDEWDNADNDKWGAQAWGKDRDVYGASSYGARASEQDVDYYGAAGKAKGSYGHGHGYGHGGSYGKAYGAQGVSAQQGASAQYGAAKSGYDNDEWAKQAYGRDFDSRWGKSYDSVSAKSYDNESFARKVRADDDQWAEDYDRYDSRDAKGYGNAASAWGKQADSKSINHGYGYGGLQATSVRGGEYDAASKAGYGGAYKKSGSDFDAWGRDQDLAINESYDSTWAKSYEAESYDEWDNKDDDRHGAQGWGKDRDLYGASSYGKAASASDYDAYGKQGQAYGQYGKGHGYGGYGGYGAYNKGAAYGAADRDQAASAQYGAAKGAYDNDAWAKQTYGIDTDSRWGKSYDSVNAKSYDDTQYSREIQADDDQWAEDYDRYNVRDVAGYGKAASVNYRAPQKTTVSYQPTYNYGYGKGW